VICGNGSADNIRAGGLYSPQNKAEDMTAPTTSATPKIALDQRASSRHDNARRMTLSAPGGGLYPTSSSTQYCEPEVTAAGGIYVDVPPTGAHVDGNLVSAKGWPGRLHLRMFGGAARRSSIRINQSPQRRFHA
jgi:hypothetical protein